MFIFAQAETKPNIIFIVVDDLNDYIEGLGGSSEAVTPNINRISDNGTLFTNAVCPAPLCCPSRTSFLTGKDPSYTNIYSAAGYKCNNFAQNFTAAGNNDEYFTIPGYLKDSVGYFTYGLNKIFHCYENYQEYDSLTIDPCAKGLSWNKIFVYNDSTTIAPGLIEQGVFNNEWSAINDTMEKHMMDYVAVDSATNFIHQFARDNEITCGDPFFIALGIKKPHKPLYIPEKYFKPEYITDFYAEPFDIPFHFPANSYPVNGILMPPQPEIPFSDYYNLPLDSLGQGMVKGADNNFIEWAEDLSPVPVIDPAFSDSLTLDVLAWSKRANCVMAYIAGIKYLDAQIGRLLDSLETYPDVYNNTIIILLGDNGYGLGEKKHWGKRTMWETDIRVPLIISDLRNPLQQVCNTTVNLLDLFPTICDLVEAERPEFSDGTPYLDGKSMLPLLEDPDLHWERPLLSTVKKESDSEGSCFPQYSVRNDRFHYIRYQSNGGGPTLCDSMNSYFEEELYEIGINREVDPNEWNNLINNNDFNPLVDYLQQWLPDSSMFGNKTFTVKINNSDMDCFLSNTDTIELSFEMFDTTGTLITPPAGYIYQWSNNLTNDILVDVSGTFLLSELPTGVFDANAKLIFYLQVLDTISGSTSAFDMKYYYIDPENLPEIYFNLLSAGSVVNVQEFSITGTYTAFWWQIEGDSVFYNEIPEEITFDHPAPYTITCYAQYGNNNCVLSFSQTIYTPLINYFKDEILYVIPNPAHTNATIYLKSGFESSILSLCNLNGEIIRNYDLGEDAGTYYYSFDVKDIENGFYILTVVNKGQTISSPILIMH